MHTIGISFNTKPSHSFLFKERGGSTNLNQPLHTYILHILYYYAKPLYYIYAKYHAHRETVCAMHISIAIWYTHKSFYSVKVHYYDIQNRIHIEATPLYRMCRPPPFTLYIIKTWITFSHSLHILI